jgi:hypothetical protein
MALQLAEFLYFSPQEREAAEKLPPHSPERKLMLERKLADIRAEKRKDTECPTTKKSL